MQATACAFTMPYEIVNCSRIEAGVLCAAMNAAFSDYVVPLKLTLDSFYNFQKQRGFSSEHSFLAMDGDVIAGFWFSSPPIPEYGNRAYTLSVGTDPQYRRKGVSRRLLAAVIAQQVASAGNGLQLEVISTNEKAVSAYEAFGFEHRREVRVCKISKDDLPTVRLVDHKLETLRIEDLPQDEGDYFDTQPTPQNSRAALLALRDRIHLFGAMVDKRVVGWGAANRDGSVAQLAVHREFRNAGIGKALLAHLGQSVEADQLTFTNVDVSAKGVNAFLDWAGASDVVRQFEMHLAF